MSISPSGFKPVNRGICRHCGNSIYQRRSYTGWFHGKTQQNVCYPYIWLGKANNGKNIWAKAEPGSVDELVRRLKAGYVPRFVTCEYCNLRFGTPIELQKHMKSQHSLWWSPPPEVYKLPESEPEPAPDSEAKVEKKVIRRFRWEVL